jgi:hypothetical protein
MAIQPLLRCARTDSLLLERGRRPMPREAALGPHLLHSMSMSDCPYLATCPIFARFKNEGAAGVWVEVYCRGNRQTECARLAFRQRGETPPESLLPSGESAPHLGEP